MKRITKSLWITFLSIAQCLIIIFCVGCSNNKFDKQQKDENIKISNFSKNVFNLNSFIDSVHYLLLETTNDCLIGSIEKMKIVNDTIFIGDFNNSKSIYAFSIKGRFLYKIANHGKGKGEFIYINDFDIIDNKVILYDEKLRKLLTYNTCGKFLYEKHLNGFLGVSFAQIGDNKLGFFKGNITSKLNRRYELLICNMDGKIVEGHFECEDWSKSLGLNARQFSTYEEGVFFIPSHGNTIYDFIDAKPQPFLNIDFGNLTLTKQDVLNGTLNQFGFFDHKKYARISNFISTENFCLLSFSYNKYLYFSLIEYPNNVLQTGEGFAHTKETDFLSFVPCYSYKNNFVSIIEAFSVLQNIKNFSKGRRIQSTKIYRQLGDDIFKLNTSSNPVLVFYTLKASV